VTDSSSSKGYTTLSASLPKDGSKSGSRNVVLLKKKKKLEDGRSTKKEIVSVSHTSSSKPYTVELKITLFPDTSCFSIAVITVLGLLRPWSWAEILKL